MTVKTSPRTYEPGTGPDDVVHLTCCRDALGIRALCGETDFEPGNRVPDHVPGSCVVCVELAKTPECPLFGRCLG